MGFVLCSKIAHFITFCKARDVYEARLTTITGMVLNQSIQTVYSLLTIKFTGFIYQVLHFQNLLPISVLQTVPNT